MTSTNIVSPKMVYNKTSILVGIRNFNLLCSVLGHSFGKPTPFLNSAGTGVCGYKKKCTRCAHEIKQYEDSQITDYPRLT